MAPLWAPAGAYVAASRARYGPAARRAYLALERRLSSWSARVVNVSREQERGGVEISVDVGGQACRGPHEQPGEDRVLDSAVQQLLIDEPSVDVREVLLHVTDPVERLDVVVAKARVLTPVPTLGSRALSLEQVATQKGQNADDHDQDLGRGRERRPREPPRRSCRTPAPLFARRHWPTTARDADRAGSGRARRRSAPASGATRTSGGEALRTRI